VVGGFVVIIVSSVLSQALCYFVCATVWYMNVGVSEQVGYLTDHWVMECKGGPSHNRTDDTPLRNHPPTKLLQICGHMLSTDTRSFDGLTIIWHHSGNIPTTL
jgi:hypothetical protein